MVSLKLLRKKLTISAILISTICIPAAARLPLSLEEQAALEEQTEVIEEEEKETKTIKMYDLPNGNYAERYIVKILQQRGITDKYALAVILGNIKQESMFVSNICEGGARVSYNRCHRGGYGLIQWTTLSRYNGLGRHATARGMNPSTLEAQVSYLFTEPQWRDIEYRMKTPNQSIGYYMNSAYYWLGWGIHGNRTYYSHQYLNAMVQVDVEVPSDTTK